MWGQWTGELVDAGQQWHALLNIDRDRRNCGRLLLFLLTEPRSWIHATLKDVATVNSCLTGIVEFSPYPFDLSFDQEHKSELKDVSVGKIIGTINGRELRITLDTSSGASGTKGEMIIGCVETDDASDPDHIFDWPEFKEWVSRLPFENGPLIFRGHEKSTYRLRTSLHRTGRRDLVRYRQEDLSVLSSYVSGVTGRAYRLNDFHDYNNLISIAQHYGYPNSVTGLDRVALHSSILCLSG